MRDDSSSPRMFGFGDYKYPTRIPTNLCVQNRYRTMVNTLYYGILFIISVRKKVFSTKIKSANLQCNNWTLYILNFDFRKWLHNGDRMLQLLPLPPLMLKKNIKRKK